METLNNYITERIRIDNIRGGFPIDGSFDDMIEFLRRNGFKVCMNNSGYSDYSCLSSQRNGKVLIRRDVGAGRNQYYVLIFANTNNTITENNPIFVVFLYGNGSKNFKIEYGNDRFEILTKDEFLQKLNKVFDF